MITTRGRVTGFGEELVVVLVVGDLQQAAAQTVVGQHQEYLGRQPERHAAVLQGWLGLGAGWGLDGDGSGSQRFQSPD